MKHLLIMLMAALFALSMVACNDDDEEPVTATQAEVVTANCDKLMGCDQATYDMLDGMGGCDTLLNAAFFADCPEYNEENGGACVEDAEAMSCEDFTAAAGGLQAGDESGLPTSCQERCM